MKQLLFLIVMMCALPFMGQAAHNSDNTEKVYDQVEQTPQYPGGQAAMFQFLRDNIVYPAKAQKQKIEGKAFVKFIIEKDGTVSQVKTLKKTHPLLDAEAVRVVKLMPKWTPGMKNGKPVRTIVALPVMFKLK